MDLTALTKEELVRMVMELTQENVLLKSRSACHGPDVNFGDYIVSWLKRRQSALQKTTYDGYCRVVERHIAPYFRERGIGLQALSASDLEDYYESKMQDGLSGNTIRRHHANIRKSLAYAQKHGLVPGNPALLVELPPTRPHTVSYYDKEELLTLLRCTRPTAIYPVVLLSSLGLRRSEALGVRWSDFDFAEHTLTIQRKVVPLRGQPVNVIDVLKTRSSNRAISIPDFILEEFRQLRVRPWQSPDGYVCTNRLGKLLSPSYATHAMLACVRQNGLKSISIKGLRHTCATLISAQGFNLKYVQEWLGHSTITITANTYTHVDARDKAVVADSLQNGVFGPGMTRDTLPCPPRPEEDSLHLPPLTQSNAAK